MHVEIWIFIGMIVLIALGITGTITFFLHRKDFKEKAKNIQEKYDKLLEETNGLFLLMGNNWKITRPVEVPINQDYKFSSFQASDEVIERRFEDAVKRQTLLSECKKYNVPVPQAIKDSPEFIELEDSPLVKHLAKERR